MEQNQVEAIRYIGSRLASTHVSDQNCIHNFHILPYLGITNWSELMKALKDISYKGDLTFEMQKFLVNMPKELILDSLKYSIKIGEYLIKIFNETD